MLRVTTLATVMTFTLGLTTSACSVFDVLPEKTTKKKRVRFLPPTDIPPVPVLTKPPPVLSATRLLRRMSLDVRGNLPAITDLKRVQEDARVYQELVDIYVEDDAATRNIARSFAEIWHLTPDRLPDLDLFAANDDALDTDLTQSTRADIVQESTDAIRYLLDQNRPFAELFTSDYTILKPSVADLWQDEVGEVVWAGETQRLHDYVGAREGSGILGSKGFHASLARSASSSGTARSADLARTLLCTDLSTKARHDFWDLPVDAITDHGGDLASIAKTTAACRSCHSQFGDLGDLMGVVAAGDDFTSWLAGSGDPAASGHLAGKEIVGLSSLGSVLANDPRTEQCVVDSLIGNIMQREPNARDSLTSAIALQDFRDSGQMLKKAVKQIVRAAEYTYGPVDETTLGPYIALSSGFKFLKERHWRGIVAQLAPYAAIQVDSAFGPGHDEVATYADQIPSGLYWHETDRLARQLAKAIVDEELSPNYARGARRVFTELPSGTGHEATAAETGAQIKLLWLLFTGSVLADDDDDYIALLSFWGDLVEGVESVEDYKEAWRGFLTGVLLDPDFVAY